MKLDNTIAAVVTGGASGLGEGTARAIAATGAKVALFDLNADKGEAVAAEIGGVFCQVDVTDDASVAAAAETIAAAGGLDVLVNNAGITGSHSSPDQLTGADALEVLDTNVASIVRTTTAFLPLLRRSSAPTIVNVTSGLGSFTAVHDADRIESTVVAPLYTASKAAVTMLTVQYAKALPEIRVNAADPGYTATDLNGNSGHQTVTEGTDAVVELATRGGQGPTGTFIDRSGVAPF